MSPFHAFIAFRQSRPVLILNFPPKRLTTLSIVFSRPSSLVETQTASAPRARAVSATCVVTRWSLVGRWPSLRTTNMKTMPPRSFLDALDPVSAIVQLRAALDQALEHREGHAQDFGHISCELPLRADHVHDLLLDLLELLLVHHRRGKNVTNLVDRP